MRLPNTTMDSDGTVKFVKPGTNQNYSAQAQVPAALSFLTGAGHFSSSFHFAFAPSIPFPGGYVLIGDPVAPTPQMTKALFWVDAQTSQVRRITLIDGQGNRNQFDFSNVKVTFW